MATVPAVESFRHSVRDMDQDPDCFGDGSGTQLDYGLGFLEQEFGSELMSLEAVSELLEKMKTETALVEEQVPNLNFIYYTVFLKDVLLMLLNILIFQHLQGTRQLMDDLGQTFNHVDSMEKSMKYLKCLHYIGELSASVQQFLMTNGVWEAIKAVESMAALDSGLNQSGCSHLVEFLRKTLCFWHNIIKEQLSSDFENALTQLHWPIVSTTSQSATPPAGQEVSSHVEELVTQLLALQTSGLQETLIGPKQHPNSLTPPLCLPIQIMLQPLKKRFRYHFCGNRQTNSLSKPEWYLTQVLIWMRNSSPFLMEKIQPALDQAGVAISVELCRGLMSLVQEKVASDASRMLYDDVLFCHLVEEVLQFEKELRSNYSYPAVLPGLFHILLEDAVLQKWLSMEKKMAVEKMDAMLSAEGAWTSQYKDISDMDELNAPECAETFMTLLQVITERYQALPSPAAQLKFLELQKELVDDFRIRLTQVMKEESRFPLGARYCAILNAVNYISTILRDWGDNVFFLQLQQAVVSLGEQEVLGGLGIMEMGRLASLEGSLFDGLLSLLDRLKGEMLGRLLDFLMRDIVEKARPYCQERWLSVPSQQDQSTMSLSSSACPMMLCVRDRLSGLHQSLSCPLFQLAWQGLADRLDKFLYRDVILSNHFSDGGAAQLQFDMSRNLFPLFGHHCRRPENFFKHVKEACIILCLSVGSAVLLKSVLKQSDQDNKDWEGPKDSPPESTLNELGVYCLSPCDVLILLNLRASLPEI
uniref:RAD50-interacting protein 1 n=1 Tax=Nothobranchius furzeri TaxID=105023 RepID=A0A8C6NJB4_NOTFU